MINNRGFTLIEVLVATVILMVGLLGLLQGINVAMDKSMENVFRNEALLVADDYMMAKRSKSFASLSANSIANPAVRITTGQRYTRGVFKNYSVLLTVTQVSGDNVSGTKQIDIDVSWSYRKHPFKHGISSFVSNAKQ